MSCDYSVHKVRVDTLLHLQAASASNDDIEFAIIRFRRVCYILASEKQKRKKVEKPTFKDDFDGLGHHLVQLFDR